MNAPALAEAWQLILSQHTPASVTGANQYFDINDLPLPDELRAAVLEWFAHKLWVLLEEGSGEPHYYHKSYDPLVIEGNTAHSYVFDMEDGGRHHAFRDLAHLEQMLLGEGVARIRNFIKHAP